MRAGKGRATGTGRRERMSHEITRVGVYWLPPAPLKQVMESTWRGELNEHKACELVARHCGDCLVWGSHATLLDAVTILAEDRSRFADAMAEVLRRFLPLELSKPEVKEWGWGENVFLRWEGDAARDRLERCRQALMARAMEFVVVESVSWEAVNDLERLLSVLGDRARKEIREAVRALADLLKHGEPVRLIHAPNIPLDWYVQRLADGKAIGGAALPFPPSPHMSVATAVRVDERYGWGAARVGEFIKAELPCVPGWREQLGPGRTHIVDCAYVVEPAPASVEPLRVTVIDRVSGKPRLERRQPWRPAERLAGAPLPKNGAL